MLGLLRRRVDRDLKGFSRVEQVKKFLVLTREFGQDEGLITPTLKLRRKEITARYRKELEELYKD